MEAWKILLVDDDPEDRAIISDAMEMIHAGDVLCFAEYGVQALEILDQQYSDNQLPCLVVLDLNMPKMNGTQTLSVLKNSERFKDITVIIYSTSINPFEREKCLQLGAESYVAKPVSFSESVETARKFLKFSTEKSLTAVGVVSDSKLP